MSSFSISDKNLLNEGMAVFHQAAQWLSMLTQGYLPKKEDDSQNNLGWDVDGLKSRIIEGNQSFYARLNYTSFSLDFYNTENQVIEQVLLSNTFWNQAVDGVRTLLGKLAYNPQNYQPITHFEIPEHPVRLGVPFKQPTPDITAKIIQLRSQAQRIITFFAPRINENLEVRIWPHHFDSGAYSTLPNSKNGIGIGWAIADEIHDMPYFYLSPYTPDLKIDYQEKQKWDGPGQFIQDSYTGATLSLERYVSLSAEAQEKLIFSFFDYAFRYLKLNMPSK